MSIKTAIAVSYAVMKDYLEGNPTNRVAAMAQNYDRVWIISITNPTSNNESDVDPLVTQEYSDRIAFQFHDVEGSPEDFDPSTVFFNRTMAARIAEFLKTANENNPYSEDLLVVNCHMGISRSGAVASFARSVFNLDYSTWKRQNPQVIPNLLVLNLLFAAWSLDI